jgi:hypothetical protein
MGAEMGKWDKEMMAFRCPNQRCRREIRVRYGDIYDSRRARCSHCKATIEFDSSVAAAIRSAVDAAEGAEAKLQQATEGLLKNAKIKLGS